MAFFLCEYLCPDFPSCTVLGAHFTPVWPYLNTFTTSLFPDKVTFWGSHCQEFNIWIWRKYNSVFNTLKGLQDLASRPLPWLLPSHELIPHQLRQPPCSPCTGQDALPQGLSHSMFSVPRHHFFSVFLTSLGLCSKCPLLENTPQTSFKLKPRFSPDTLLCPSPGPVFLSTVPSSS